MVYSNGVRPPQIGDCTELSVALDGHIAEHWVNRRWPDDILAAVPWLVSELAKNNHRLKAGQKILTGAWGPPLPLERVHSGQAPLTTHAAERSVVPGVHVMSTLFGNVTASFSDG